MKILIAIPCFDHMPVPFVESLLGLQKGEHDITIKFASSSLIYDARNQLANYAIVEGYDFIMWFDSDMLVPEDTIVRLVDEIGDAGLITGMYVNRRGVHRPAIFTRVELEKVEGGWNPVAENLKVKHDKIFEIDACGFGCVLTRVSDINKIWQRRGLPFSPRAGFGEDISFCMNAKECGVKMLCDPNLEALHIGSAVYGTKDYKGWENNGINNDDK